MSEGVSRRPALGSSSSSSSAAAIVPVAGNNELERALAESLKQANINAAARAAAARNNNAELQKALKASAKQARWNTMRSKRGESGPRISRFSGPPRQSRFALGRAAFEAAAAHSSSAAANQGNWNEEQMRQAMIISLRNNLESSSSSSSSSSSAAASAVNNASSVLTGSTISAEDNAFIQELRATLNPNDITKIPDNGLCLYLAILHPFGLATNENAKKLACIISNWIIDNRNDPVLNAIFQGVIVSEDIFLPNGTPDLKPLEAGERFQETKKGIRLNEPADEGERFVKLSAMEPTFNATGNVIGEHLGFNKMKFIETLDEYAKGLITPVPGSVNPLIWLDNHLLKYVLNKIPFWKNYQIVMFQRDKMVLHELIGNKRTNGSIFLLFTGGNHYNTFNASEITASDRPILQAALNSCVEKASAPVGSARARLAEIAATLKKGGRTKRKNTHKKRKRTAKRRI